MAKDKCDNCGATHSKSFWDFKDGSVLCDSCNSKYGEEWSKAISSQRKIVASILIVLAIVLAVVFLSFQSTPNIINQVFASHQAIRSNNLTPSTNLQAEQGPTCAQLNGNNCNRYETCSGTLLLASDSSTCCSTSCLSGSADTTQTNEVNNQTIDPNTTFVQPTYTAPDNSAELALQAELKSQMESCKTQYSTKLSEFYDPTKYGKNLSNQEVINFLTELGLIYKSLEDIKSNCIYAKYNANKQEYDKIYPDFSKYLTGVNNNQKKIYDYLTTTATSFSQVTNNTGTTQQNSNNQANSSAIDTSSLDQRYTMSYNLISQRLNITPQVNDQGTLYMNDGDVRDNIKVYLCAAVGFAKTLEENLSSYSQSDLTNVQNKIKTQTYNIQNIAAQYYNASSNRHNYIHSSYQTQVMIEVAKLVFSTYASAQSEDVMGTIDNLAQLQELYNNNGGVINTGWGMKYAKTIDSTLGSC